MIIDCNVSFTKPCKGVFDFENLYHPYGICFILILILESYHPFGILFPVFILIHKNIMFYILIYKYKNIRR